MQVINIKNINSATVLVKSNEGGTAEYMRTSHCSGFTWYSIVGGNHHSVTNHSIVYELETAYQEKLKEDFLNDKLA